VHAAGSSHCGEIKSKSTFSRDLTRLKPKFAPSVAKLCRIADSVGICFPTKYGANFKMLHATGDHG
jgi:hypothetical protein